MVDDCPFCARADLSSSEPAFAFDDHYPVASGHRLVVPRRHVERLEELDADDWAAVFRLVHSEMQDAAGRSGVDGVNVGVNSGRAAGQTVDHAHVHVIPRTAGDVEDARGGVRWVVAKNADYWSTR